MFNLPKTTEVNRTIPKKKFYEKAEITPALKEAFVNDIEKIVWANKLSADTLNIDSGSDIKEIEVFHVLLKNKNFNQKILEIIDKAIPYYILFILDYNGRQQIWLGYKEKTTNSNNKAKIIKYFKNEWQNDITLTLRGTKLDSIYENFLSDLSSDLNILPTEATLEERIQRTEEIDALTKKIEKLEIKLHREKQFNRQIEINKEIKNLRKQLVVLKNNTATNNQETNDLKGN